MDTGHNQPVHEHDHDTNDHYHENETKEAWEDFLVESEEEPSDESDEDSLCTPPHTSLDPEAFTGLKYKWNYYYHLPNDKTWSLSSYKRIISEIDSLEKLIAINENITENIIKNCMLFVMKSGITPMWEDTQNRNGGCFSYKVSNKVVVSVWRDLMYSLCGGTLTVDRKHMDLVNGITISPKRGFCIVKIWLKNCTLQDPNTIIDIDHLIKTGCLFKTHKAEF
jgi:Eukaryotic initiation factor 4E